MDDIKNTMELIPSEQKITLVTMFFDIGKREQNTKRRQASEYLKLGKYTLSLDLPMVIYIDPEFEDFVREERRPFQEKTKIVPINMEELPYYEYLERIYKCRELNLVDHMDSIKNTPLYLVSNWSKFTLLERVLKENPFQATHLGWIDFGVAHVAKQPKDPFDQVFTKFDDKIRFCLLNQYDTPMIETDLHKYYAFTWWTNIAAGYMTGDLAHMQFFCDAFKIVLEDALKDGYAVSEEKVFPVLCYKFPEKFSFYYGDYKEVLLNYRRIREGSNYLLFHSQCCKDLKDYHHSVLLGEEIIKSLKAEILKASPYEVIRLLDDYYIGAYYHYYPDQTKPLEIARFMMKLVCNKKEYKDDFLGSESHQRQNFSFLKENVFEEYDNQKKIAG